MNGAFEKKGLKSTNPSGVFSAIDIGRRRPSHASTFINSEDQDWFSGFTFPYQIVGPV